MSTPQPTTPEPSMPEPRTDPLPERADAPADRAPLTDEEWARRLTPQEFDVLRRAGTERPYTGEYWDTHVEGVYACRACGQELFRSSEKFDSHCGWPSFFAPLAEDRVEYIKDASLGMERIEVRCAGCGSHMGHVFAGEGYGTPTDLRYCINSISLRLDPRPLAAAEDATGEVDAPGRGLA
ncbi:peptide-methionine (R)-S-oxide reductase MsrB [Micrococcus flavus]|uniref:peptide-methionine (R)-S-oxide reductase n=2 Tax=Micrococcus flavus TaxID=384602 RepID=A0A4Y8X0K9_9MICC|nr:peptide-methionine (R)-S-oxide reductase MsrB [Micrococcus flavus]MBB4882544.1 peptide-methionine (R)-S-oxide reductase [Micrococcus flavus]TFI02127.1 peptide-methionine (R)-S-oxide reductase MsrB [Micrococcus flavus]